MPIPVASPIPLSDIERAWEFGRGYASSDRLDTFTHAFLTQKQLPSPTADFVRETLKGMVSECWLSMGMAYGKPKHPGLNEHEFGLLRMEELFCRFIERLGPAGAAIADTIARQPHLDDERAPIDILSVRDGHPVWLWILAQALASDGPDQAYLRGMRRAPLDLHRYEQRALPHLAWTKWLLLTDRELVEVGVPRKRVNALRLEETGHDRPLTLKWARALACGDG